MSKIAAKQGKLVNYQRTHFTRAHGEAENTSGTKVEQIQHSFISRRDTSYYNIRRKQPQNANMDALINIHRTKPNQVYTTHA